MDIARDTKASPRDVLEAVWELAWAGFVTNDTFAPVRALAYPRHQASGPRRNGSPIPPEAAGRWWALPESGGGPGETLRAHALATVLLERYGVVTREVAAAEGITGGFSAVYPVLKAMEETGRVRRGYFIDGLGGAQFALPGAVERLRAERDPRDEARVLVLAATDPAQPYGALVPFPRRDDADRRILARAAGARVVFVEGEPVLYIERGGKGVVTLPAFDDEKTASLAAGALAGLAAPGGRPQTVERIDGEPTSQSPRRAPFISAGFEPGFKGLTYRAPHREGIRAGGR